LPTAKALTGRTFIEMAATSFGVMPSFSKVSKFMLSTIGLFNKAIGETVELYYQYQYDYIFDSTKFEQTFNFKPTPYEAGMKEVKDTLFKK
jgi:hypothetical protein